MNFPKVAHQLTGRTLAGLACGLLFVAAASIPQDTQTPGNVDYDMYFNSAVFDDPSCRMEMVDGRLRIDQGITNPAFTCPDMLAWKTYVEVVRENFVARWASGDLMWPAEPLPLCTTAGQTGCCSPGSADNPGYENPTNPSLHCPYYPDGANPSSLAVSRATPRRDVSRIAGAVEAHGSQGITTQPVSFFNRPMFDYAFGNNLYNTDGLIAVLNNANADLDKNAPFRAVSRPGALTSINFPVSGWMIRSQWIKREDAIAAGLRDDPASPFIKIVLTRAPHINFNPAVFTPGEYWLTSFHVSTKDTPPWFWADFEHIQAPGRCDYTGCNDSYGYETASPTPPNLARNFTPPNTTTGAKGQAYSVNGSYASGPITPALRDIFRKAGIGAGPAPGDYPAPGDKAWLSYRLRGSQWDFTDPAGRPSYLGATASNGGIVTGSSCISCHATAATYPNGPQPQVLGLYQNWAGTPNPANFNLLARPATNLMLQNDFVWGFVHTAPLVRRNAPAAKSDQRSK